MAFNIIFYLPTPGRLTGAPRRLLTLCKCLLRSGTIIPIIISEPDATLIKEAETHNIQTTTISLPSLLRLKHGALLSGEIIFRIKIFFALLVLNIKFLTFIRNKNVHAIWLRGSKGLAFAGLGTLLSRKPLIWDIDYELPSRGIVRVIHRLGLLLSSIIIVQYPGADKKIFGEHLAKTFHKKFCTLIPGIDFEKLYNFKINNNHSNIKIKGSKFIILQIGSICDRKNQKFSVEILKLLKDWGKEEDMCLKLVGGFFDQKYADTIKAEVIDNGLKNHVEFLGWQKNIFEHILNADIIIMPSKDEGVPNAIQEAMYLGRSVIVSDKGGMPSIIQSAKTGWIHSLDDLSSWAKQILICKNNPILCQKIADNASQFATLNFNSSQWAKQYEKIICKRLMNSQYNHNGAKKINGNKKLK